MLSLPAIPYRGHVVGDAQGCGAVRHELILLCSLCESGWIRNLSCRQLQAEQILLRWILHIEKGDYDLYIQRNHKMVDSFMDARTFRMTATAR